MGLILRFLGKNARQYQIIIRNFHSKTIQRSLEPWLRSSFIQQKTTNLINLPRLLSANAAHHDHTKIWVLEKVVSATLLGVIPAALVYSNPILDYILALSLIIHTHWGFEAIVVDYIRPSLFGPVIPKIALGSLYLLSIMALAGLFYLNYSDVGLATAIKMFAKM